MNEGGDMTSVAKWTKWAFWLSLIATVLYIVEFYQGQQDRKREKIAGKVRP